MTKEREEALVAKYPAIFRDYGGDPKVTCMAFGLTCGDGWCGIIDALCSVIDIEVAGGEPPVVAAQVKEKFGGLRFYYDGGGRRVDALVTLAEALSLRTCEHCGAPGTLIEQRRYLKTLCESCAAKRAALVGPR